MYSTRSRARAGQRNRGEKNSQIFLNNSYWSCYVFRLDCTPKFKFCLRFQLHYSRGDCEYKQGTDIKTKARLPQGSAYFYAPFTLCLVHKSTHCRVNHFERGIYCFAIYIIQTIIQQVITAQVLRVTVTLNCKIYFKSFACFRSEIQSEKKFEWKW